MVGKGLPNDVKAVRGKEHRETSARRMASLHDNSRYGKTQPKNESKSESKAGKLQSSEVDINGQHRLFLTLKGCLDTVLKQSQKGTLRGSTLSPISTNTKARSSIYEAPSSLCLSA